MPQAVQNPLLIQSQPSYSTQRPSQPQSSDGPSFQDTLKDAQTRDSQPVESDSSYKTDANNSKPSTTAKASKKESTKKGQSAGRKSSTKSDQANRKSDSEATDNADEQSTSHDQQPTDAKEQADGKADKKKAADPQAGATQPTDAVQIQNPAALAANPQPNRKAAAQDPKSAAEQTSDGKKADKLQAKPAKQDRGDSSQAAQADDQASSSDDASPADESDRQPVTGKHGRGGKQGLAIQARKTADKPGDPSDAAAANQNITIDLPGAATAIASDPTASDSASVPSGPRAVSRSTDDQLLKVAASANSLTPGSGKASNGSTFSIDRGDPADATPAAPEAQFADANHARIVSGIHGQLLPNGGSMQIRLDPPELGSLNVRVEMKDGVMTASFETTNDHATRLLSHSLSDLKTALESQGVSVDKLQVRQSPKDQQSAGDDRQQSNQGQDQARQQEQQRKEMVRRMWQKLMKGSDPLDLVA